MQATNEANELWAKAEQRIADVLHNVDKVVPVMQEAEKKHPNRYDFLKMTGAIAKEQVIKEAESSGSLSGAFGAKPSGLAAQSPGFGSTSISAFGSNPSPSTFGSTKPVSDFGAASQGQSPRPSFGQSGFAQPSATATFGKPAGGAFGQPSSLAQTTPSLGFGTSGFTQPVARNPFAPASAAIAGQPSQSTAAFGQTSQPTSAFGQPAFGQAALPPSGFGQSSQLGSGFGQQPRQTSGFGQPSQPSTGFGQALQPFPPNPFSGFGQPSKPTTAFGQTSQAPTSFGQSSPPAPGFGQPAQAVSSFGQTSQPTSAFVQPSRTDPGFGQPSQTGTINQTVPSFAQPLPSQTTDKQLNNSSGGSTTTRNPFNQPSQPAPNANDRPNPFVAPSSTATTLINTTSPPVTVPPATAAPTASSTTPHPLTSKPPAAVHYSQTLGLSSTRKDPSTKRLTDFKNRPVKYINDAPCYERPDGKGWERIWFPDGVENVRLEDVQQVEEVYTEEVKQAYQRFAETGAFEVGKLPTVAPMREWAAFDF